MMGNERRREQKCKEFYLNEFIKFMQQASLKDGLLRIEFKPIILGVRY